MARKPTQKFGTLSFSKDGKVTPNFHRLSEDKPAQELDAFHHFLQTYNARFDAALTFIRQLGENDHDFIASNSSSLITVQLTELVDRMYTFEISQAEYDACRWRSTVVRVSGERPWGIDEDLRDKALMNVIDAKLKKNYSKPKEGLFWLVVFATQYYPTEYFEAGVFRTSAALSLARNHLSSTVNVVFDEVWFTDLLTSPVKVWPLPLMA